MVEQIKQQINETLQAFQQDPVRVSMMDRKPTKRDIEGHEINQTVDYYYDLELSQDGTITGWEWYQNRHPDFLWTPPPGARARTVADQFALGEWIHGEPVPESWRRAARRASDSVKAPLAKTVERLIDISNG